MWLNFIYTVKLLMFDVCTKFQNSRSSSSGEIFDENFHMHYIGEIEQELSHDSIARLNCALPITKTISVIR